MELPEKKYNLSSTAGIRRKDSPNATQHRPWPKPKMGRDPLPTRPPKPKPQVIGNHDWTSNYITFEDSKPFEEHAEFFSIEHFQKYSNGVDIVLNSQMAFENSNQVPLHEIKSVCENGMFIAECFRRIAKFIESGPGKYKIFHKDRKHIFFASRNQSACGIHKLEQKNLTHYIDERLPDAGEAEFANKVKLKKRKKKTKIGNEEEPDPVTRTKFFKAAVIDSDGSLLDLLFSQKMNLLEYGKIISTNLLLQRFFTNIFYWEIGDKKILVLIHPNYESSIYKGIKAQARFDDISPHVRSCTLGYGLEIPPFFRRNPLENSPSWSSPPIEEHFDMDPEFRLFLENKFQEKMYGTIHCEHDLENYRGEIPISTTYCEQVFSSFYISKNPRKSTNTKKPKKIKDFFNPKSDEEREEFYNGDDFIQCYEIEKVSDHEIKVKQLKV
jgi:hypothetical protein